MAESYKNSKNLNVEEQAVLLKLKENVSCIDIDNDGIMEIIIDVPQYEGNNKISVIKYNKGNIDGKLDIKATVEP